MTPATCPIVTTEQNLSAVDTTMGTEMTRYTAHLTIWTTPDPVALASTVPDCQITGVPGLISVTYWAPALAPALSTAVALAHTLGGDLADIAADDMPQLVGGAS